MEQRLVIARVMGGGWCWMSSGRARSGRVLRLCCFAIYRWWRDRRLTATLATRYPSFVDLQKQGPREGGVGVALTIYILKGGDIPTAVTMLGKLFGLP